MTVIVLWLGVVAAFLLLIAVHLSYWKDARDSRRDSSRFELFAVRDRLVYLVASNEMEEDEPAWQMMYVTVNSVLDLSYQMTILGQLIRIARLASRIARDKDYAERVRKIDEMLKKAARKTPEFSEVVAQMDKALASMSRARTPEWQWWTLLILVLIAVPYTFLKRAARDLFFHQSTAVAALRVRARANVLTVT